MTFAEKLQRMTEDLKKCRVARRVGIDPAIFSRYLHGHTIPRADLALKLARTIGVSLDWMMDDQQGWPPVRIETETAANQVAA